MKNMMFDEAVKKGMIKFTKNGKQISFNEFIQEKVNQVVGELVREIIIVGDFTFLTVNGKNIVSELPGTVVYSKRVWWKPWTWRREPKMYRNNSHIVELGLNPMIIKKVDGLVINQEPKSITLDEICPPIDPLGVKDPIPFE